MAEALPLMIQGTQSDAGKSIVVTALCRIFMHDGHKIAPFKSQNMALNSYITIDGKEIGRAQGIQAEAAGIIATTDMNPILIKPTKSYQAQIVIHGKPYQNMEAQHYRTHFYQIGKRMMTDAYKRLAREYEYVVIEGAGSPAEINLNDRELVNMSVARMANAPVILVADIDRGGVFASLVGTLQLLEQKDRDRVVGVIINKFRGDISLLTRGLKWFEEYTQKPVLGVIPFIDQLAIDEEDSLNLSAYSLKKDHTKVIDIAVICYPFLSNYTDVNPFRLEQDCHVRLVRQADDLKDPDLIIMPGSKNTIDDLLFLQKNGLAKKIMERVHEESCMLIGICGGYQMLGEKIMDPSHVESSHDEVDGLGFLPVETRLTNEKKTIRSHGQLQLFGEIIHVQGYEIHMGQTIQTRQHPSLIKLEDSEDGSFSRNVIGTYFHGIFENDHFRSSLLNSIRKKKGLTPLKNRPSTSVIQEEEFNRLARHVRQSVNIERIYDIVKNFKGV